MTVASLTFFSLLCINRPFLSKVDNLLTSLNTFFLVLLNIWGVCVLALPQSSTNALGLALIVGVVIINLVNFAVLIPTKIYSCVRKRREKGRQRKQAFYERGEECSTNSTNLTKLQSSFRSSIDLQKQSSVVSVPGMAELTQKEREGTENTRPGLSQFYMNHSNEAVLRDSIS